MQISFDGRKFIAACTFEERAIPKSGGFSWDAERRYWYTDSVEIARRLFAYADESAKRKITAESLVVKNWSGAISHPEHLRPFEFQKAAVRFALERNRSYLGLEPGLGKTICAALIHNSTGGRSVYICPPFLVSNVAEELRKWCESKSLDVLIIKDSMLDREATIELVKEFRAATLIVDEAHRFKTASAQRSKALFRQFMPLFRRVVFLSGTPMPNRPMELYPVLSRSCPELIGHMNQFNYGLKYCAGFRGNWGWDFSGSSNLKDLRDRVVGRFMYLAKKADVLPELPPKSEELIFIDEKLPPKAEKIEQRILAKYSPQDLMKYQIGEAHIASYRRALGKIKVPATVEFVRNMLEEESNHSILVFAIHREVIDGLAQGLRAAEPLIIHGDVPVEKRHALVQEFQSNPKRRVMILNIAAGGVGFNLTKACRVVFAEFSWTPAENDQAIDRAHRIGQGQSVLAQYVVFKNSIDRAVMSTVLSKKTTIKDVLS